MTNEPGRFLTAIVLCSVILATKPLPRADQSNPGNTTLLIQQGPAEREGQHDFDFEFGAWKAHLSRLQQPLTGSTTWLEYEGTSVVRKVWDGRANLGELDVRGPAGHIEGLTLRLYSPKSRQWNISWANASDPGLGEPMTGEFKDGRGEFYGKEPFNGRMILVRFVFSDITPTSFRFEQAFSPDWGKTWEVNWKATFTR
jgi:hypothetical protein